VPRCGHAPGHRRGAAGLPDRSCRSAASSGSPAPSSPCATASAAASGYPLVFAGSSPITHPRLLEQHTMQSGSFPRPAVPGVCGRMTLSDAHQHRHPSAALRPLPSCSAGLPRLPVSPFQRAVPTTPADQDGCVCRLLPHPVQPSPLCRRVGIRIFTFEACSGCTRVTAHCIAQPPKAAFVTRLRPARLPSRVARQLPDQTDYYLGGTSLHR
jgi:hypothetical protein